MENTPETKRGSAEALRSVSPSQSQEKSKVKERDTPRPERFDVDFPPLYPNDRLPEYFWRQGRVNDRFAFRCWPRNLKGHLLLTWLPGKEAGNGLHLWGATLYDFYYIRRFPGMTSYMTLSTGSRLAKWMRKAGELTAKDELAWADLEEDPKEIPVDTGELIKYRDMRVFFGMHDQFSSRREVRERAERKSSVSPREVDLQHFLATGAWLDEPMQVEETEDAAKDTDESAVSISQHDDPVQVEEPGDNSSPKDTDESIMSISQHGSVSKYDSPFNPAYYPSPWPLIPCTHDDDDSPPILQQRLPLHLLPQKLHVHDPWNRLSINEGHTDYNGRNGRSESGEGGGSQRKSGSNHVSWLTKVTEDRDIIRTYSLSLSTEGEEAALASREKAEMAEDEAAAKEGVTLIFPSEREGRTDEPLIEAVLPPRPRKRTQVEEAHLYISPPAIGKGNHSFVYFAEWELPRDIFMEAHLCKTCVEEDVSKQLQALKDQGKWEELLKACPFSRVSVESSGLDTSPGPGPSHANGPKRTVGHVTIEEYQLPHRTVPFISPDDLHLADSYSMGDEVAAITSEMGPATGTVSDAIGAEGVGADIKIDVVEQDEANKGQSIEEQSEKVTIQPPRIVRVATYTGPILRIHTTVKWQDTAGIGCKHKPTKPVPRTTTVGVAAKLSIQYDTHLEREARNYQSFPSHFFEHWNGYNVIPPLNNPVPVGALCPQFYGYYTRDDPTDGTRRGQYLSPILLLEHCGSQVVQATLNEDDREVCASLLFRFHYAGWLHDSFAERNILWQRGKPTEWSFQRTFSKHKSFRLIDFGRSKKIESSKSRLGMTKRVERSEVSLEEEAALGLFQLHVKN